MPFAENLGTGGGSLDAQYGSSPTANTNAPLLLDPRTSGNFVYTPGTAGNYVAVPHSDSLNILGTEGTPFFAVQGSSASQCRIASDSNLNVTGDLEVVLRFSADNWVLPLNIFISRGANPLFCWRVGLTGAGNLFIDASPNGLFASRVSAVSTVPVPFVNNVVYWVRIRFDVNNGAGGNTTTFEWAADSPSEPTSWTAIGSPVTNAGTTSIFATTDVTAFLQVGCESGSIFGGRFYRAIVRNGFAGPAVADINFTQQALGVRGFIESTGKPVTLNSANGRIVDGTTYGFLPGVIGSNWSAPDSAALDIAGDIDIKVWLSMNDWTPAALSTPVGKWNGATPSYHLRINTDGTLALVWVDAGGTTRGLTSTVSVGLADGSSKWIRGTLDVNNGAGQAAAKFYTSDDGTTWTQLGTTVTGTFGTSSIRVGTALLTIGQRDGDQPISGRVFRVIIQSAFDTADNVASKVFDADFTRQLQFVSAFVEDQNLAVVTAQGAARIERDRDLDLRVKVALDDWTPASLTILAAKWNTTTNQRSFYFGVEASGELRLSIDSVGTSAGQVNAISTVPTGIANGSVKWVRVTLDVNDGSGGRVYTFFLSDDGVTWTQLGATVSATGAASIFNGTALVELGSINDGTAAIAASKFYAVQMLNGINGPAVLDIDFTDAITTGAETYLPDTPSEVIPEALQFLPNLGWGGTALNARFGSAVGADTNDPLLLTHTGTNYLYLPGVTGNFASTPDAAPLDITGDIDLRVLVALDDWTPSSQMGLVMKFNTTGNQRSYGLNVETGGTLSLRWSPDGSTSLSSVSTIATGITDGSLKWVRGTLDVDDGAGNRVVTFYVSDDGVTWAQLGAPVVTAGATSIFNGTASLEVGSITSGSSFVASGKFYRAQVLNGIGGTVVFDANFTTGITSGAQTTFTESSTNAATVTINRSTSGRKSVAVVQDVLLFGTDDYLEVPDSNLLDFGATDSFTVMTAQRQWASLTAIQTYLAKTSGVVAPAVGWATAQDGTGPYFVIGDGTAAPFDYPGTALDSSMTTIIGVRDVAADTLTAYRNATANAGATDTTTGTLANAEVMRIGRLAGAATNYSNMEFRGSAVWRRALTAAEVALVNTHYTTGPTTASTALMQQAVWWVDAGTRSVAQINRSTSGRKSVACARCTWLLGTDDYFEVPASNLFDFAQGQDYTLLVLHRGWWAQGTNDTLLATQSSTTASAAGWAMSNSSGDPWQAGGRHGDGSIGVTAVAPRRDVGTLTGTFLVRDTLLDTLTAFTGSTSGTPVTDTTTGTIGNTNVMRLGRLSTTGTEYLDAEVVAAVVWRRKLTAAERAAVLAYYGV